jgi:hypothetical protein
VSAGFGERKGKRHFDYLGVTQIKKCKYLAWRCYFCKHEDLLNSF